MEEPKKDFPPDLSGILTRVMSNPEAIGMLTSLLGGIKTDPPVKEAQASCEKKHEESILLPSCPRSPSEENRKRLLLALKPFLTKERQAALDRILMISEALALIRSEKRG